MAAGLDSELRRKGSFPRLKKLAPWPGIALPTSKDRHPIGTSNASSRSKTHALTLDQDTKYHTTLGFWSSSQEGGFL